jgi:osmoprotectant transport system substrate-binding protein
VSIVRTVFSIVVACAIVPACGGKGDLERTVVHDDAITVASFNFSESQVVAEIYAAALEGAGVAVDRQMQVGTRELVLPALQRGLLEVVPEYAGSAVSFLGGVPSADTAGTIDALAGLLAERGIEVLRPAQAQSENGLVVSEGTARRLGLRTIGDLAPFAGTMTLGGPPECPERALCLPGFEQRYGLRFRSFLALDAGGPVTAEAIRRGAVDAGILFTSDGALTDGDLSLLRDDLGLQPAENIVPVVRADTIERFGSRVVSTLNAIAKELTTEELRRLNALVANGTDPAAAARSWLEANDLAARPG